jgi:2-polyprenyl-3-methyl-5-hydroxy-6-metoxy-1,4-benzoquinol methylase
MPRVDQVRTLFERPERYLDGRRYNIMIRAETVNEFVRGRHCQHILDIGCGDGSISLPLLRADNQLTLVDVSSAMLAAARRQTPPELVRNVEFVNGDFLTAPLVGRYDLILCVGVFAHANSPASVIAKLGSLLEPGGDVIVQFTDYSHLLSRILASYDEIRNVVIPQPYCLTSLGNEEVLEMFVRQSLRLVNAYRYSLPLPGMARMLGQHSLYRLTRWLHGYYPCSRNARLGNECLYQFRYSV